MLLINDYFIYYNTSLTKKLKNEADILIFVPEQRFDIIS